MADRCVCRYPSSLTNHSPFIESITLIKLRWGSYCMHILMGLLLAPCLQISSLRSKGGDFTKRVSLVTVHRSSKQQTTGSRTTRSLSFKQLKFHLSPLVVYWMRTPHTGERRVSNVTMLYLCDAVEPSSVLTGFLALKGNKDSGSLD